jgi:hypothetical protein
MTAKGGPPPQIEGDDLLSDDSIHVTGAGDIESVSVHSLIEGELQEPKWKAKFRALSKPVTRLHQKTPYLKRLPAFVLFPITILVLVNCLIWAITGVILRYHPYLFPSLGLMVGELQVRLHWHILLGYDMHLMRITSPPSIMSLGNSSH